MILALRKTLFSTPSLRRSPNAPSAFKNRNLLRPHRRVQVNSDSEKYPSVPPASGAFGDSNQPESSTGDKEKLSDANIGGEAPFKAVGAAKNFSFVAFWVQLALAVVSTGILVFSVAFVPPSPSASSAVDVSKYLTLLGVIASFISCFMARAFLGMMRNIQAGKSVARTYLANFLLTNNTVCLAGAGFTVLGLQASVGTLVAKSMTSSMVSNYPMGPAANALASFDVFALQASTNTLLCHIIGLLFTNIVLKMVNSAQPDAAQPA